MILTASALAAAAMAAGAGTALALRRQRTGSIRALLEQRYNVLESIPDGIFILDASFRFTHVNERAEAFLNRPAGSLIGTSVLDVLDPLGSELYPEMQAVRESGEPLERLQHFQSTNTWIEIRIQPARDELLVYLRDVTQRKRAEVQSRESDRRLRLLLSQCPAVLWTCDMQMQVTSISGAPLAEDDLPFRAFDWLADELPREQGITALRGVLAGEPVRFETYENGRWMQNDVEPLRDDDGMVFGAAGVALDVTEVREAANRFAELARQDVMTQLPNRLALDELLPPILENATATGESVAVLFVDIDRFKTINDTLGHHAGDDLLRLVTQRLQQRMAGAATICRFGGDEFVIVASGMRRKRTAAQLSMEVLGSFAEPFVLKGRELFVTASVGASLYPDHAKTADELIAFADAAMYRAKEAGGNNAKFYDGMMHAHVLERMGLEQDLRQALARGELSLEFQPIVDSTTHHIVAAEALLRWRHPLLGALSPATFVPIAEESGAIVEIGRWVLRESCKAAARIRESVSPNFRIAVNLSSRDLYEQDFAETLKQVLQNTGLPAPALDLEITENAIVDDLSAGMLFQVAALGVKICVDDFGTGYSSLGYLKRFPVDAIKIDKSFIQDVARDPHDRGIVKAICTLGQTLGLRIVAEGIETQIQSDFMNELNCHLAQGFFFHRPLPWPAFWDVLQNAQPNSQTRGRVIPLYG